MAFDKDILWSLFTGCFVRKPLEVEPDDVAGMIVSINPDLFTRTLKMRKELVYFNGGPSGQYLKGGNLIAFLVDANFNDPRSGIKAVADLVDIKVGSPEEVSRSFDEGDIIFSKDRYARFARNKTVMSRTGNQRALARTSAAVNV